MSLLTEHSEPIVLCNVSDWHGSLAPLKGKLAYVPETTAALEKFFDLRPTRGMIPGRQPFSIVNSCGGTLEVRLQGSIVDYLLVPSRANAGGGLMVMRLGYGYQCWGDAFRAQTVALSHLIDAVYARAGLDSPRTVDTLPATLVGRTTLLDEARRSAPPPRIQFAVENGLKKGSARELELGDLVDVTTRFRFVLVKAPDGLPRPCVLMEFVRVVRLKTCSELTCVGPFSSPRVGERFNYIHNGEIGATPVVSVFDDLAIHLEGKTKDDGEEMSSDNGAESSGSGSPARDEEGEADSDNGEDISEYIVDDDNDSVVKEGEDEYGLACTDNDGLADVE